jgi:hypothetical protein
MKEPGLFKIEKITTINSLVGGLKMRDFFKMQEMTD